MNDDTGLIDFITVTIWGVFMVNSIPHFIIFDTVILWSFDFIEQILHILGAFFGVMFLVFRFYWEVKKRNKKKK